MSPLSGTHHLPCPWPQFHPVLLIFTPFPFYPPSFTMPSLPPSPCHPSLLHHTVPPSFTMLSLPPSPCHPSLLHHAIPPSFTMLSLPPSPYRPSLLHCAIPPSFMASPCHPSLLHHAIPPSFMASPCHPSLLHHPIPPSFTMSPSLLHCAIPPSFMASLCHHSLLHHAIPPSFTIPSLPPSPSHPSLLHHVSLPPSLCHPSLLHHPIPPSFTIPSLPPSPCLPPSFTVPSLPPSLCHPSLLHCAIPPSFTIPSLPPSPCYEHVINQCGSEDLKQQMQDYVDELSTFKETTRLCDFIESRPCRDDGPPEDSLKKVVVKLKHEWSQCTLQDVESSKKALVHKFFLPEFDMLLQKAERGCVCVTWLTSPSLATLLQQNLANIEAEFFKKHGIDAVTIDGQEIYLTPVKKYSGYLRDLYNSEQRPVGIGPPTPADKLLPFKLARIEKEKVSTDEFTRRYLRGDMDDVGSLGTEFYKKSPIEFEEVGKLSSHLRQKLVLIEGAPGVGKTTFSWEFCRKWGRGEILQDHSLLLLLPLRDNNLKEAKTLSDLFYHPNSELQQAVVQEVTSNQGQGVAIWLEAWDELDHEPREKVSVFLDLILGRILPLATVFITSRPWASEHLRKNYEHQITQHVEVLTSAKDQIEHYISKAEAEAQPSSFAAKFTDYLSSNPVIKAAMYTPVTAKMAAEVFTWSQHTETHPPTTMTELFTAFTLKTLIDHLSTHPVYHKQQLKVTTFSDLPTVVYKQFQGLCRTAYEGILNRQQLVFSAANLPTGFAPLGLMQEVPQLYTEGRASSYHFIHLTIQEYLAAVHIPQLPVHEQTRLFQEHVNSGHFKMTMRFFAGRTKLANIPPDITMATKLNYFHFLFEAKDISMTTRTLGSDEMVVKSDYSWTPLDYYVTGHAISHSNCPWRLDFISSSIDDDKFELFCQGCTINDQITDALACLEPNR